MKKKKNAIVQKCVKVTQFHLEYLVCKDLPDFIFALIVSLSEKWTITCKSVSLAFGIKI